MSYGHKALLREYAEYMAELPANSREREIIAELLQLYTITYNEHQKAEMDLTHTRNLAIQYRHEIGDLKAQIAKLQANTE